MKSMFNRLEKIVFILAILSTLFLLFIQFLSYDNNYTIYTSKINRKIIFAPFSNADNYEKGIVILKNMSPNHKEIDVLLNGDPIDNFIKNDEIKIYVYDNDMIEIDGTRYDKKIPVKIIGVSNNIEMPKLDTTVTTSQSIEIMSKVQLK
ncbi:MAG: hypothetical protein GX987_03665 [Tissierellia bacterium]|nr:hypothetical protein [Tissierellia bacterium]